MFIYIKSKSQDPQFTHIDKSSGLSSNAIYNIFQDSKGYMWFSCDKGLIRYDGFEFTTFSHKLQSSKSGTNIQEDKYGRIWYQNFDGYVFYVEQDSLHLLTQNRPAGYFNYGLVGDHLFLIQAEGLDVYDIKTLKLKKRMRLDTKLISSTISDHHNYYVYNEKVLHVFDKNLSDHAIVIPPILLDNGCSQLINAGSSVFMYAKNNKALEQCYRVNEYAILPSFPLSLENIQNASYTNNAFWFCTAHGAYQISETGHIENKGQAYFKDYDISYVFKDRENNYWFSTLNNGLLFVKNLNTRQYFNLINPIKSTLLANDLYVGANEGKLYKINLNNKEIKEVYKSSYNKEISTLYYDSIHKNLILSNNDIEILDQTLKCSWHAVGALKDVKRIDSNYYAFALSGACALYKINKNKKDTWTTIYNTYKTDAIDYARFALGYRAKAVEYDEFNRTIYFGTSYGLMTLTPNNVKELKMDTARVYITRLCKYNHIIYGLSTAGDLIQIIHDKARRLPLSLADANEAITFIKVCGHYLFLTTNQHLYSIDLNAQAFKLHLQHKINYDITDIDLWNQQLLIITRNGIITEQLTTTDEQNTKPLFYITRFMVNALPVSMDKPIDLSYDQNNIEINYSILSFKTDFNFPLYYKINNAAWEKASNQTRTLNLSSLAPGNYKITFKPGEVSNTKFKEYLVAFTISKAYWQTWWFIGLWVFLAIVLIIGIARWRIHELKQKNKLLNEKIENEQKYYKTSLKAIKAQMNPHFFYNALNTIQSFIYSEDKKNASTYLSKFSKLTRLILEMSEKDNITLSEEINTLQLYLDIEKVRFNDDFEFSIHSPPTVATDTILFPPMLIQPYVENAIKHGLLHKKGAKVLDIRFEIKDQLLSVIIDDNGIGRKQSKEINSKKNHSYQSFSSGANEQRFKILSSKNNLSSVHITDKFDSFSQSTGTTVNLVIPVTLTQK